MSRKTTKASIAAIAASLMVVFASADGSGAIAQDTEAGETIQKGELALTDEIVPEVPATEPIQDTLFISEEVAQPVTGSSTVAAPEPKAASLHALVADMRVPEQLSEQMQCLAGAVYFEARGEPLAGQLAVARVVINRAESSRFPASYCGVVYQRAQFSFVNNGSMPRIKTGSRAWQRARAVARIAHEGMWDSQAADSLYFHANYVKPRWARAKQARATINTHIFYR
ncbi:cell wall hydrolase [Altererythrobacter sp. MF3-039]|uniref:cell wall hydrolase n=1 Tax=Altererythrobacter sp. MF3-039 TaxID=3252901 RepID=UPI00390C9CFF